MTTARADYREWTPPARTMAQSVDRAVGAACASDSDDFATARADLRRVDREQLAVLLGTITQDLLQRAHPDGVDADDARAILDECDAACSWFDGYDEQTQLRVLVAALGVGDAEDAEPMDGPSASAHGVLLIAVLITRLGIELAPSLNAALSELMRAQTVELP